LHRSKKHQLEGGCVHFNNRALVQELKQPASLYFKPEGNQESYEGQHTLAFVKTAPTKRGLPVCHLFLLVLSLLTTDAMTDAVVRRLAVGSKNPVKVAAATTGVRNALERALSSQLMEIEAWSVDVPSGVSDQPLSDSECKTGACNRAMAAFAAYESAHGLSPDFSVGLEGGVTENATTCCAWMAVYDGKQMGTARTCTFPLPPKISELVRSGVELGIADDQVFGSTNSKHKGGTVGHLTRGGISRTDYYIPAVELACIPLLWPELYVD